MLRLRLCAVLLLALAGAAAEVPVAVQCLEHDCFALFWGRRRFAEAGAGCAAGGGRLMSVRSTVAADAVELLAPEPRGARLWLGLELAAGRDCTEPGRPLRGFRWTAGDERTDYTAWRRPDDGTPVCARRCVAVVHKGGWGWEEERCDSELDGFLCEYNYAGTCGKLAVGAGVAVDYTTPFGARDKELLASPPGTIASIASLGVELMCRESSDGGPQWAAGGPGAWHCEVQKGGCQGTCSWEPGGPRCACREGEQLKEDRRGCVSVCANTICEHHCIPKDRSFTCMCEEGYELAEDGVSCRDVDDCQLKPNLCDQECVNTVGAFRCECRQGYEMVEGKCEDVIDCAEELCQHKCVDVPGGFECTCFDGYAPDPKNLHKCVLFCNQSACPADCDPHTRETCYCPSGFILDVDDGGKQMCMDINECDADCDQLCTNMPGSYRCDCTEGYILQPDQRSCRLEDEFSGETPFPETPPTRIPPKAGSLHPGVLVGISIGILSSILALMALLYHLIKKHCIAQGNKGYKCNSSTEKEVGLQQVTTGCPSANQKL